jgi:hypothetical protein
LPRSRGRSKANLRFDPHAFGDEGHACAAARLSIDDDEAIEADAHPAEESARRASHGGGSQDSVTRSEQCGTDTLSTECNDWLAIEGECQTFAAFDTGRNGDP